MVLFPRDYERIATVIRHAKASNIEYGIKQAAIDDVVFGLADLFEAENPDGFKRDSFILQCTL